MSTGESGLSPDDKPQAHSESGAGWTAAELRRYMKAIDGLDDRPGAPYLRDFINRALRGEPQSPDTVHRLMCAFLEILEGIPAARALRLNRPKHRPRKHGGRNVFILRSYDGYRQAGQSRNDAIRRVAQDFALSDDAVEKILQRARPRHAAPEYSQSQPDAFILRTYDGYRQAGLSDSDAIRRVAQDFVLSDASVEKFLQRAPLETEEKADGQK